MTEERAGPDEQPVTSKNLGEVLKKGPVIHSFVIHPDGSVEDVVRRRPRSEGGRYTTLKDLSEVAKTLREK